MENAEQYDFLEWHKLNVETRMDLIPLIEGARDGAKLELYDSDNETTQKYIDMQKSCLFYCLERFGLHYREAIAGNYYIARNPELLDKLWEGNLAVAEFLGYPECCASAFYDNCRRVQEEEDRSLGSAVTFYLELAAAKKAEIEVERELLFVFHVPCSIKCEETLRVGADNMAALSKADIEAFHFMEQDGISYMHEFYFRFG